MTLAQTAAAPDAPGAPPTSGRARYIGIDLARFLAIAGMMGAHLIGMQVILPKYYDVEIGEADLLIAEAAEVITAGTAASLFAVLGGLSIVFATRRLLRGGRIGSAIGAVAVRGAVLVLLGLLLGQIENNIVVVLAYYGIAMLLVAPLVAAPSWVLGTIAGALLLCTGPLNALARRALEVSVEGPHLSYELLFGDPLLVLRAVFLTGEYPAVTWACYLLVGILIGRLFVSATSRGELGRTAARLAAIGAALFAAAQIASTVALENIEAFGIRARNADGFIGHEELVGFIMEQTSGAPSTTNLWINLVAAPHTGSIMDLLRTIGLSSAVIGLLVLLCDREGVAGRAPARAIEVLRATGAAPLTVYTLHIVVSGMLLGPYMTGKVPIEAPLPWWVLGLGAYALQLGGAILIGAILSRTGKRGPLEALLSRIVGLCVR